MTRTLLRSRSPSLVIPTNYSRAPERNRAGLYREAAIDAILMRQGLPLLQFDSRGNVALNAQGRPIYRAPSQHAAELASSSLVDIGDSYLRNVAAGMGSVLATMGNAERGTLMLSRSRLARYLPHLHHRGVSLSAATGDYPGVLADAFGKTLKTQYAIADRTWRKWAREGFASNFQTIRRVRLEEAPELLEIGDGEQIVYATPGETVETFRLATFTRGFKFTREMFLNDDLSAFSSAGEELARAAYRLEDKLAYAALAGNATMSDGSALFSTAHANVVTGELSVTSLGAAREKLAAQSGANSSDPLDLPAAALLVPKALATTAEQLVQSLKIPGRADRDRLEVVSTAHLTGTAWYLAAPPEQIDTVSVAFLTSEPEPVVREESEFSTDAIKIKVRHTVAAAPTDHRGLVRSSGA